MDRLTRRQRSALFLFAYIVGLTLIVRDAQAEEWPAVFVGVVMLSLGVAVAFGRPRLRWFRARRR